MDRSNTNKSCVAPLCYNTSKSTPQKLFIHIPKDVKRRNLWLRIAKLNPKKFAERSKIYFCEDHFDLKTDVANYDKGLTNIAEMVPGCIPTKFKCQTHYKNAANVRNKQVLSNKTSVLDLTIEQKEQADATTASETGAELKHTIIENNKEVEESDCGISENMNQYKKVFSANITRNSYTPSNNLQDLLKIVPASPVNVNKPQSGIYEFTPNTDKYYIPKKKSRLKVRTVRSLRKEIEQDVYGYLPKDLEKQKSCLLKKIMDGSAKSENTRLLAQKILESDQPIMRSSWEMLMNINPDNHQHSKQFVLWHGKCIQVSGSKGGNNKFVLNYDLGNSKLKLFPTKQKILNKKKGLLQNSLSIKFKPGPLKYKKLLDVSHQKHNIGLTELVNLPKPGLDIQPFYGMTLESSIAKFVNSLREENGKISEKWAEFAVTMLGSIQKSKLVQQNPDNVITFDLNYKYNQSKILMRRDVDEKPHIKNVQNEKYTEPKCVSNDLVITSEIECIIENMLDSVEISLQQDSMYTGEDELRDTISDRSIKVNNKEKQKKRCCELGRLDVTVIRLPEDSEENEQEVCNKPFCTLGCVCDSLECSYSLKNHCGLLGCMFQCVCDFSRYVNNNLSQSGCSDFIPGLINLDSEINSKLAKEEQKFHQTVIVSGEKSVLLKKEKRNWKASKKYEDFYTNLNLKVNKKAEMVLSIVKLNLNRQDLEPWCMVHNLYKCFCKGRFTETSLSESNEDNVPNTVVVENIKSPENEDGITNKTVNDEQENSETITNSLTETNQTDLPFSDCRQTKDYCARVKVYKGRKYSDGYYKNTNRKIRKMEQDDGNLRKRLMVILNNYEIESKKLAQKQPLVESITVVDVESDSRDKSKDLTPILSVKHQGESVNKSKLVAWLESSYKLYKQRTNRGITKTSLEPPVLGKLALYTWEFILKRYKQRKNFFMVSKKAPFRIFIAVNAKSSVLKNCININNIELADLHRFPATVKNLLTSACDSAEEFCILCGWGDCWEIIGSVSKLNDKCETDMVNDNIFVSKDILPNKTLLTEIDVLDCKDKSPINCQSSINLKRHTSSESSKWFVMTVENDFNEIQFHARGFFVTYSSIIKAINVARRTGKTVRLSSQKCAEKGSGPQFGIYAIPDAKEYCVFVGPYEMHEHLGIETVINKLYVKKDKKTRGVWITTDKVDNGKVIDNPLLYMPFSQMNSSDVVDVDTNDSTSDTNTEHQDCPLNQINLPLNDTSSEDSDVAKTPSKCMKPIKIRKTQDFYQIASNGALKKIFFKHKANEPNIPPSFLRSSSSSDKLPHACNIEARTSSTETNVEGESEHLPKTVDDVIDLDQPVDELNNHTVIGSETTTQLQMSTVYSEKNNAKDSKQPEKRMFILNPEQINQKILQNKLDAPASSDMSQNDPTCKEDLIDMDVENFLVKSLVCQASGNEVLEISDDSDDETLDHIMREQKEPAEVWIQSKNIDNFGWIKGRKNYENLLSFEFPGFKPTDFYETQEAFSKINQVLSRKIYIPKNISLAWEVIESERDLKNKKMLLAEELGPDFVLTKHGIRHKQKLLKTQNLGRQVTKGNKITASMDSTKNKTEVLTSKINDMTGLEEQSVVLENESNTLWNETLTNKAKILQSLSEASEENKQDMTKKLKSIMSMTEN